MYLWSCHMFLNNSRWILNSSAVFGGSGWWADFGPAAVWLGHSELISHCFWTSVFPDQGPDWHPLHQKCRVLATEHRGSPWKLLLLDKALLWESRVEFPGMPVFIHLFILVNQRESTEQWNASQLPWELRFGIFFMKYSLLSSMEKKNLGLPWWSSGICLGMQETWVWSLVGELPSHMPKGS